MRSILLTATLASALALLAAGPASAGESYTASSLGTLGFASSAQPSNGLGLLDPDRLSITRSVSFGYSSGAYGGSQGLFLQHMAYRISDPLSAWVDVGYSYRPSLGVEEGQAGEMVVPSFGLHYQPRENLFFQFSYRNLGVAPSPWMGSFPSAGPSR